jgi:uncharacterized protein YkwD
MSAAHSSSAGIPALSLSSRKSLLGACLLLAGCAEPPPPAPIAPPPPATGGIYQSMSKPGARLDFAAARDLIAMYRAGRGLEGLSLDPGLMAQAQAQADAMAATGKLSHEVQGSLTERLNSAGYVKSAAVENVSAGYDNFAEVFSGWRQSPPHNSNMLAPRMRRMGVAVATNPGTRYKLFWALVLAN